jgi:hypothetical protein
MSYGGDITDPFRQAGSYTGRVLAGQNSATAPLMTSPVRWRPPMPHDDEHDYEVGYGKRPPHTRLVKGQSGTDAAARPTPRT